MTQEQIDALRAAASDPNYRGSMQLCRSWDDLDAICDGFLALLAERDALLRVAEAARAYDASRWATSGPTILQTRAVLRAALAALTPGEATDVR